LFISALFDDMKKLLSTTAIIIFICATFCNAQNTVSHSAISFRVKNLGVYTEGTIGGLQATIHFNAADMASATIDASVDANTLNTDNSLRDEHIKSDEFFDVAHFPKILLKSVSIKHNGGNKYTGRFNLTIKNKTKAIDIPFTCSGKGDLMTFKGGFTINRRDYALGDNSLTLSDEVIISIEAEFRD
jgi:polyisoprenoid-binding protein YceI